MLSPSCIHYVSSQGGHARGRHLFIFAFVVEAPRGSHAWLVWCVIGTHLASALRNNQRIMRASPVLSPLLLPGRSVLRLLRALLLPLHSILRLPAV